MVRFLLRLTAMRLRIIPERRSYLMQTPTLVRRKADTPTALTDELVSAQQQYTAVKNSVIARATSRRDSIREIQADLADEDQQLAEVVSAAK